MKWDRHQVPLQSLLPFNKASSVLSWSLFLNDCLQWFSGAVSHLGSQGAPKRWAGKQVLAPWLLLPSRREKTDKDLTEGHQEGGSQVAMSGIQINNVLNLLLLQLQSVCLKDVIGSPLFMGLIPWPHPCRSLPSLGEDQGTQICHTGLALRSKSGFNTLAGFTWITVCLLFLIWLFFFSYTGVSFKYMLKFINEWFPFIE